MKNDSIAIFCKYKLNLLIFSSKIFIYDNLMTNRPRLTTPQY